MATYTKEDVFEDGTKKINVYDAETDKLNSFYLSVFDILSDSASSNFKMNIGVKSLLYLFHIFNRKNLEDC